MKEFICQECQKKFDREKFRVGHKYCSIECFFWSGVNYHRKGCWPWQKRVSKKKGYGTIRWQGVEVAAHRVGYAAWHGHKSLGDFGNIYNTCGDRTCCRGDHWEESSR